MNERLAIYLWSISSDIKDLFLVSGVITSVFGIIFTIPVILLSLKETKKCLLLLLIPLIGLFSLIVGSLIPNKQDLALIMTYPVIKQGIKNISPQLDKVQKVADLYLEKQIKELQK